MIELDGKLSELARLRSGSEPIVSLYLDVRWSDEKQRERIRLFMQDCVRQTLARYHPDSKGRDALARNLARIQEFVTGLSGQAYENDKNGLALFACESLGLWTPLFFQRSFQNELATDHFPHLLQLARLLDGVAPAIVVSPSQAGSDIYFVKCGELDIEASLRGFVPRRDKDTFKPSPGAAAHRYERLEKDDRHQDTFIQKNHKAAAAEVTHLFDARPGSKIILVGTSETIAGFERHLPDRIAVHVIARVPRPRDWGSGDGVRRDGVVRVAESVLQHVQKDEENVVDAVIGEALRGGLGVIGPEDVVLALNEGRVHRLVLEEDFQRAGYRCDNCDTLGANAESTDTCPFCGATLHVVHHLREALVARALGIGAEVEIVAHTNKLHSYRSVAAFLRQTGATGMKGHSSRYPTAPGANQS